ncbi:transcriptional regulator, AraC family [Thiorhodococcus drewsii AZ1]|uniref:Transcriptional regulator, AraC family n=1 Tax=Thiorhodococcus drewsii AZ1 TaxID=765913 RepID=G2DXB7_9GAMM|nr:helix-turn-helix domain-containing protein [Thiorhodococcus drewsii]EGV33471.1 transcriptional regulator, AraC family [Thiorhodococcus drewsii AZ1]
MDGTDFSRFERLSQRNERFGVVDPSRIEASATLFDALAQGIDVFGPHESPEEACQRQSVLRCGVGRVEMLKIRGAALAIDAAGCGNSARIAALVLLEGAGVIRQGERRVELEAGDLCLLRSGRALSVDVVGPYRLALVEVSEEEVVDRFPLWRAAMMTPIRGTSGVPAVFCDAVRSLHRWQDSLSVSAGSDHLADVIINLIGALVCFAVPVNKDCLQQSLYQKDRIKKVVLSNLRNPDLDVDLIAESVGLSARQVHRVFADEGTSLMRWVWVQRLEECYRELCQESSGRRSISDVAFTWGFNDQAHFSRAFRKHFGLSPRDARRRASSELID